tara:strand:+ start:11609 stop:12460 length:852 start_codon:yes stop_codon:yes gene_type:complete
MSLSPISPALIFTDLDGSLLDHDCYSFEPVIPLLETLESKQVPVIPITSKTFAEVEQLRGRLNNHHPFIIENGAAIAIPKDYFLSMPEDCHKKSGFWVISNSRSRQHWNRLLEENTQDFIGEFETFTQIVSTIGIKGIQDITGLGFEQAQLSNQRDFSEPVHWLGSEHRKQEFINKLSAVGATLLQGGRFLSVGDKVDKGSALVQLTKHYQQQYSLSNIHTLAIGDSGNDINMLEVASSAIIIRSKTHPAPTLTRKSDLLTSNAYGPEGWAETVSLWLKNFQE